MQNVTNQMAFLLALVSVIVVDYFFLFVTFLIYVISVSLRDTRTNEFLSFYLFTSKLLLFLLIGQFVCMLEVIRLMSFLIKSEFSKWFLFSFSFSVVVSDWKQESEKNKQTKKRWYTNFFWTSFFHFFFLAFEMCIKYTRFVFRLVQFHNKSHNKPTYSRFNSIMNVECGI